MLNSKIRLVFCTLFVVLNVTITIGQLPTFVQINGEILVNGLSGSGINWNPSCASERNLVNAANFQYSPLLSTFDYFTYFIVEQAHNPSQGNFGGLFRATYCSDRSNTPSSCPPPEQFNGWHINRCHTGTDIFSGKTQVRSITHPANKDFILEYQVCSSCSNCNQAFGNSRILWWNDFASFFKSSFSGPMFISGANAQMTPGYTSSISCTSTLRCNNWPTSFNSCQ